MKSDLHDKPPKNENCERCEIYAKSGNGVLQERQYLTGSPIQLPTSQS